MLLTLVDQVYSSLPTSTRDSLMRCKMSMIGSQVRAHFSNFISPGDLVFDVGANVGDLTRAFLDLGADVICIDPQPYCIQVLQKRFDGNNHVTIVEKGVSNEPGNLPFFISSRSHSISTFSEVHKNRKRFKSRVWDKTVSVPVTTLDVLIERYGRPSFCKIDVESFEWRVIQGLNSKIPGLSFEFTREFLDDAKKCAQRLALFGDVRFNYALYASYRLTFKRWLPLDCFFDVLESSRIPYLFGDVYARFTD